MKLSKPQIKKLDKEFQKKVIERDGRCIRCGRIDDTLTAHHIITRRRQDTRHDLNNGVTLCYECHRWAHDNPKDFKDFINGL